MGSGEGVPRVADGPGPVVRPVSGNWPAGAMETAAILDDLAVPLDAPTRTAEKALRESGSGRRSRIVRAALKYRRQTRDAPPDAPPDENGGTHPGRSAQEPDNEAADAPGTHRDAPPAGQAGRSARPVRDALLPAPPEESIERGRTEPRTRTTRGVPDEPPADRQWT